jgi:hypothetical protein
MNKTVKATLWIIGVFAALSLGVYFAGCGDDETADAGEGEGEGEACAAEGDACTGGKCFKKTGTEDLFCAPECTTVGDACEGGGCYYTEGGNYCFEAGTKVVGETCGAAAECVVGVQCLDAGAGMVCWQVCAGDEDCTEPATCGETGLTFKVCQEAEE